jgi:hypothetical protein
MSLCDIECVKLYQLIEKFRSLFSTDAFLTNALFKETMLFKIL